MISKYLANISGLLGRDKTLEHIQRMVPREQGEKYIATTSKGCKMWG